MKTTSRRHANAPGLGKPLQQRGQQTKPTVSPSKPATPPAPPAQPDRDDFRGIGESRPAPDLVIFM